MALALAAAAAATTTGRRYPLPVARCPLAATRYEQRLPKSCLVNQVAANNTKNTWPGPRLPSPSVARPVKLNNKTACRCCMPQSPRPRPRPRKTASLSRLHASKRRAALPCPATQKQKSPEWEQPPCTRILHACTCTPSPTSRGPPCFLSTHISQHRHHDYADADCRLPTTTCAKPNLQPRRPWLS